jgi:beta-N-acetylhexosaminidase
MISFRLGNMTGRPTLVGVASLVTSVVLVVASSCSASSPKAQATALSTGVSTGVSAARACAAPPTLSRRAKLRQLVMVGFRKETPAQLKKVAATGVGGFILFGNYATKAAISKEVEPRLAAIKAGAAGTATVPWMAIDEEGGVVQRLRGLGVVPSARELGTQPVATIESTVRTHAEKLRALGFDMDYAPVLDLDDRPDGIIATRSFSADAAVAWPAASSYARGLIAAGVLPVYKHFPGHGTADGDSHKTLPTTKSFAVLQKGELPMFQKAIDSGARMIMVGHLIVPGLSANSTTPTSADPAAYKLLRSMGFTGVATTDALDMSALSGIGTIGQRAAAAVIAGADVVLLTAVGQLEETVDELDVAATKGTLSATRIDEAWGRVWCAKTAG